MFTDVKLILPIFLQKIFSMVTTLNKGKKLGFNSNLIEVATSITTCVASSGGLERQFSTLGMNYGKLQSNLEVQKAGRIAFLYRQLNDE